MVRRTTREVVELAAKACKHAEDGNYMSIFDWPPALGLAKLSGQFRGPRNLPPHLFREFLPISRPDLAPR